MSNSDAFSARALRFAFVRMNAVVSAWNAEHCAQLLEKARKTPTGWKGCCPVHDDNDPSLFLADGVDGLAAVCYAGCPYEAIIGALESRGAVVKGSRDRGQIPTEHFQLGPYSSHWDYRDPSGRLVMRVCRWEQPGGKKDIRPLTRTEDGWKWAHHSAPRPLFQLDRLTNEPELPVLLVEGEKTAVAAQKLFPDHIATTWAGGAGSMGHADLAPLTSRDVVLVPDCDTPGRKAMAWIAKQLRGKARSVRTVDPVKIITDLREGWDLADALVEGRDVSTWLEQHAEAQGLLGIDFADMRAHLTDGHTVKGLAGKNSIVSLVGATGSSKTFLSIDLAVHIAARKRWRGCSVDGGLVVYAALEGSASAENRFVACRAGLHIEAGIPLRLTPGPINLRDPVDVALLIEFVRKAESDHGEKCVAVFIDTLSRAIAGGDENAPDDMGALIAGADAVRLATGATLFLVHHLGKDESRGARGHSSFRAALDTEIEISVQGDVRVATVTKQRDLPAGRRFAYTLKPIELGLDLEQEAVTSCVVEPVDELPNARRQPSGKNQTTLLAALQEWQRQHPDNPVLTTAELREIGKVQELPRKRLQEAVAGLEKFGWLAPSVGGFRFIPEASS